MIETKQFLEILKSHRLGKATKEELEFLYAYYNLFSIAPDVLDEMSVREKEMIRDRIEARLLDDIGMSRKKASTFPLWKRLLGAAAVTSMTLGLWFYYTSDKHLTNEPKKSAKYANDVAPGKMGATLTLSDGRQIKLSDAKNGELANQSGVIVSKAADGQIIYHMMPSATGGQSNTLSTAKGETYQVKLPDGSTVWLNAVSSLTYPASFNNLSERRVKLTGEAYLKVAKDKSHPFIVETGKQEVEVLGTEFNINSYTDEHAIATTLIEGSVKVRAGGNQQVIKPGEQVQNRESELRVTNVNIATVVDWKEGEFNLDGLPFRLAMRKLARWYNVEVIYDASVPDNIISGGWISRNTQLSTILDGIEKLGLVKFRLKDRIVYVTK